MKTYSQDLFTDDAIRSPHPHYEAMRALGPVVWLEATGCWATSNHAAAESVLSQPSIFLSGNGVSLNETVNKLLVGSTLNSDGEEHARRKKVSVRPLTPVTLKPLEPSISAASVKLVDSLPERIEAVSRIAQFLPLNIVVDLIGLPDDKKGEMLSWASATFNFLGPDNERSRSKTTALQDMRDFISSPDTIKRLSPDGWAAALHLAEKEGKIPKGWASEQMRDYINPSLDTTIAATAFGLYLFARNPDQWQLLRAQPKLISNAIEEVVRLCTPIRGLSRSVAKDCTLAGQNLKKGDRVWVLFAAANRDPAVFDRPDHFDILRNNKRHFGFGYGKHSCLGVRLARLEMQCLFTSLAQRMGGFELDGEAIFGLNNIIYGLERLPLRLKLE